MRNYTMVAESTHGEWKFENQTTACVIKLTLKDKEGEQEIWMDYYQFEQLAGLIKQIEE